jgi:hypothetical protein
MELIIQMTLNGFLEQIVVESNEINNLRTKLFKNMEGTIHLNKTPCGNKENYKS